MTTKSNCFLLFITLLGIVSNVWSSGVGGYSATITLDIPEGNATHPYYKIASASISGSTVYSGIVSSVTSTSVLFESGTDESNATTYPFKDGVFDPDIDIPIILVKDLPMTDDSDFNITYPGSGYDKSNRFTEIPDILIDASPTGQTSAILTCTLNTTSGSADHGKITTIVVSEGGTGYTSAGDIDITVVGGPHFIRNTNTASSNYGATLLIKDNNTTAITSLESRDGVQTANSFFAAGDSVEIVPAPTIGSVFGRATDQLEGNFTTGNGNTADYFYLYDSNNYSYMPFFMHSSGIWYDRNNAWLGDQSAKVIWPDEAFIIARRNAGKATFTFTGTVSTDDQKLYLPSAFKQALMNNPYGTTLLLGELIPSTSIGNANDKFNPGATHDAANTDIISFLAGGSTWIDYYYDSDEGNTGVTEMHEVAARRPLDSTEQNSTTFDSDDLFIGEGSISNLESCDDTGDVNVISGNDSNFTKITLSRVGGMSLPTGTNDLKGFTITISSVQGRKLNDDGTLESDENGTDVANGSGVVIYSNLNGSHEIILSGSGYIVIEKIRDVNIKADEVDTLENNALANWSIGNIGAGYSNSAKVYLIGGGSGVSAKAAFTIHQNATSIISTDTTGSGYTGKPQAIVTGGGWRTGSDPAHAGNTELGSTDGILIYRGKSTGVVTFIESANPSN